MTPNWRSISPLTTSEKSVWYGLVSRFLDVPLDFMLEQLDIHYNGKPKVDILLSLSDEELTALMKLRLPEAYARKMLIGCSVILEHASPLAYLRDWGKGKGMQSDCDLANYIHINKQVFYKELKFRY